MTVFVIVCAIAVVALLAWLLLPLLRPRAQVDVDATRKERRLTTALLTLIVPLSAAAMYAHFSEWDFDRVAGDTAETANIEEMLQKLEDRLTQNPEDVTGWLLLGRSYGAMGKFPDAAAAYQKAYDLTAGEDLEAVLGLGEALTLNNERELSGRAGQLFEAALLKQPNNAKALWYGSLSALQQGDLRLGRDRLRALLALGPPEELRTLLERQIQDLNQQIGEGGLAAGSATPPAGERPAATQAQQRTIRVAVSIAPELRQQLTQPRALFVLARSPGGGGPPLAVKRLTSNDLPLTVELSESDAMIEGMGIGNVPKVEVVARLSGAGSPQAQSGDFYGQAEYEFGKDSGTLNIIIDRTVP